MIDGPFGFNFGESRFHRAVWQMCAYLACLQQDIAIKAGGDEFGIVLHGNTIPFSVQIALNGIYDSLRASRIGAHINWGAAARPHTKKAMFFDLGQAELTHAVLTSLFSSAVSPFIDWMKDTGQTNYHNWPPVLNFSRVVRNAISHSGKINIANKKAPMVNWRGTELSYQQNEQLIGFYIGAGDIIVLLFDLNKELTSICAPFNLGWQSVEFCPEPHARFVYSAPRLDPATKS